jgi:hypothetical protein
MTCRHAKGDPNCSSHPSNVAARVRDEVAAERRDFEAKRAEAETKTPDAERYEIVDTVRVGPHLVAKVLYPNCKKCSYEGNKVMVWLNVTEADALRWRRIDPHFRDPGAQRSPREAPGPAARFPASDDGWHDALSYARTKAAL